MIPDVGSRTIPFTAEVFPYDIQKMASALTLLSTCVVRTAETIYALPGNTGQDSLLIGVPIFTSREPKLLLMHMKQPTCLPAM